MRNTVFRETRWKRAGATNAQLDELRAHHDEMTPDQRVSEGDRVDSLSDGDLAAELAADDSDLSAGTMAQVLERVGDNPESAAVAKSHEERKPKPRPKLIEALDAVIAAESG
jgi:hypothetical protein